MNISNHGGFEGLSHREVASATGEAAHKHYRIAFEGNKELPENPLPEVVPEFIEGWSLSLVEGFSKAGKKFP